VVLNKSLHPIPIIVLYSVIEIQVNKTPKATIIVEVVVSQVNLPLSDKNSQVNLPGKFSG
jgi:hypothetical protein